MTTASIDDFRCRKTAAADSTMGERTYAGITSTSMGTAQNG
jgi:hypothetical protein